METPLTAAEEPTPPRPDGAARTPEGEAPPSPPPSPCSSSSSSSSSSSDPMEAFRRRLEDIIRTHGSDDVLLDEQTEAEAETVKKEPMEDIPVAIETEVCLVMKSLKKISSPEKKLEEVVRRYAEVVRSRTSFFSMQRGGVT
ncbi:Beta-taxilin [Liparis tanakae]|uniref:Beta-taxilin n=1 Tax=Liparis tanakae TaxID=230148 RepID=A0A4Z2E7Q7_9TELE|nr:Beta-taxilin [Liparis tanakae]